MPKYLEMVIGNASVLVETSEPGDGVVSGGDFSAFIDVVGAVAAAVAGAAQELASAPRIEVELGVAARAGGPPVIVLERTNANVRVRVVLEGATDVDRALAAVPRPT